MLCAVCYMRAVCCAQARHMSKMCVRRHNIGRFLATREQDVVNTTKFILSEGPQGAIDGYMAALKARSQAKKK